jgi:hypothetical protein
MAPKPGGLAAEMREIRPTVLSGSHCQLGGDNDEDNTAGDCGQACFLDQRSAALALLNGNSRLTRKAGQFLGQLAVDSMPLSEAQQEWLQTLLDRAGLPPMEAETHHV